MFRFKRILAILVAITTVGTTLPVFSQSIPRNNRALITVTQGNNQRFNPLNGPAAITMLVTGATALDVTARVYALSPSRNGDLCPASGVFVDDMNTYDRPAAEQFMTGSHTLYWDGMNNSNHPWADGKYCYRIEWSNAQAGVNPLREGFINVDSRISVTTPAQPGQPANPNGGGSTGNGNGSTGSTGGSNGNNGGGSTGGGSTSYPPQSTTGYQDPARPDLNFSIFPDNIYPESRETRYNTSTISYTLNSRLTGFAITIRDRNNVVLQTLRHTTGKVGPESRFVTWNGRSMSGRAYPSGAYSVVFSSGPEITRGTIYINPGLPNSGNSNNPPVDNGEANSADISVNVHPTTIDPTSNDSRINTAILDYTVRRRLTNGLSIVIYDTANRPLKQLKFTSAPVDPHSDFRTWNGRYENASRTVVPEGRYRYSFKSGLKVLVEGSINVQYGSTPNPNPTPTPTPTPTPVPYPRSAPSITDYGPNPSTFEVGGSTDFRFSVNQPANVTLTVYQNNSRVKTVFDGPVSSSKIVTANWATNTAGTYTYIIEAWNNYGRAISKQGTVRVTNKYTPPPTPPCCKPLPPVDTCKLYPYFCKPPVATAPLNISEVSATAFNPNSHFTTVTFTINQAAYITSTIRNGTEVDKPINNQRYEKGTHTFRWNGTYQNGGNVPEGTYTITISGNSVSNKTSDSQSTTVFVRNSIVNPVPPVPPYPPFQTGCGKFVDVPYNHPLCQAIDFVTSRGIFTGYQDGSGMLGINQPIRRAEFLAVVQKAFKFNLDSYSSQSDGTLGYRDLYGAEGQWFMPYVKTFSRLNIMVGYPDNTMRPDKIMGTAELFVSFFQAAERAQYSLLRFRVNRNVDHQPYADTPVNADTYWYIGYAMFARIHDLVPGDFFYPGRGITRGQVIELIYQTFRKGLIDYGANTLNPTYPANTPVDYYYPNSASTQYPYNPAPVIDYNTVTRPNYVDPMYTTPSYTQPYNSAYTQPYYAPAPTYTPQYSNPLRPDTNSNVYLF